MDKLIIEFSKYVLITLMVIYTLQSILIFAKRSEEAREFLFIRQNVVMFCLHFVAFMVLYLQMNQSLILFFLRGTGIVSGSDTDLFQASVSESFQTCDQ